MSRFPMYFANTAARVVLAAALGFFCLTVPARAESVIRVGGNGTALELIKALIPPFRTSHPEVRIEVMKSLGSSGGVKALNAGALDLAVTSRPLQEQERAAGATEVFHARTPFIFMAHQSVPATGVTTAEVEAIYSGRVAAWPDGSAIKLVLRPKGDTDTKTLQAISPAVGAAVADALQRRGMLLALTDEDSDRYITRTSGAFGTSSLAQVKTGKLSSRILAYNGARPTLQAMESGRYPLAKEVILVVRQPDAATRAFVQFVSSSEGKRLLRRYGAIPALTGSGGKRQ